MEDTKMEEIYADGERGNQNIKDDGRRKKCRTGRIQSSVVRTPRTPPLCVRPPSRARAVCIRWPPLATFLGDTITLRWRSCAQATATALQCPPSKPRRMPSRSSTGRSPHTFVLGFPCPLLCAECPADDPGERAGVALDECELDEWACVAWRAARDAGECEAANTSVW
ncbi:hypothetical protein B0H17DRAFT_1148777 [Mycena rosella]|uniref:Uncharacterized protein n=1 Tax=Mycena rosella TaxID=1033263 RepID=A0AAD7FWC9_MYCRO|nr:hypothetical protein B0H17DRAFT_1148777 [Mycena rosella]